MSNRQITTSTLDGWDGPHFTQPVLALHRIYAFLSGYFEKCELIEVAARVRGFWHAENVDWAEDAYIGLLTAVYVVAGGLIAVRFPRFHDSEWEDGTLTDRCVALYTMGPVMKYDIERIADALRKHLEQFPIIASRRLVADVHYDFLGELADA